MSEMSGELWEKMKDGRRIREVGGIRTAFRNQKSLMWDKSEGESPHPGMRLLTAREMFELEWELVEEEEKEMETEKWVRDGDYDAPSIIYKRPNGCVFSPSNVMDQKSFMRWVGAMPKESHMHWPGDRWCIWVGEDGYYNEHYEEGSRFTNQIFADYALMRKEAS